MSSSPTSISSELDESETANVSRILIVDRPFAESSRTRSNEPIIENNPTDSPQYTILRPEFPLQSSNKATNGPWFSLEGKNLDEWRAKLLEFGAWIDLQMAKSNRTLEDIIREFFSRFTGMLRDWFQSLGEYRQLQFICLPNATQVLNVIFSTFIGDAQLVDK
ncbi:hypothetical protein ACOSQ4_023188 [Xanthoceras sorbifolium]